MFCKNCGTENVDTAKFCKNCGTPLIDVQEAVPPVQQYQAPPQQQQPYQEIPPIKPKKKRKGCLMVLLVLGVLLLALVVLAALNGGEFSFSTANIKDATIASQIDPTTSEPTIAQDVFPQYTTIVYVTAYIKNVPSDTKLSANWTYVPSGESLQGDPVMLSEDAQIQFNVEMPNGFIAGEYKVDLLLNDEIEETLYFIVE